MLRLSEDVSYLRKESAVLFLKVVNLKGVIQ